MVGGIFVILKDPKELLYKYKNLCETNDPYHFKEKIDSKYLNLEEIKKRVDLGLDIIGRDENYKPVNLDDKFPDIFMKILKNMKNG